MLSAILPNTNQKISVLNFLVQAGEKLTILIPYKALLLTKEVRTIKIGKDFVILQVPDQQFCSHIHERVFLVSSSATHAMAAKVQEINFQKGIITLIDFNFLESPWYERKSERVEPRNPTTMVISQANRRLRGRLENLSLHGLGVLLYTKNLQQVPGKIGENLKIEVDLGNAIPILRMKTNLVTVCPLGQYLTHLGLAINLQGTQKTIVSEYINSRKHDILNEFERISIRALEPISSMDLYF
jgi:hypothetical protein